MCSNARKVTMNNNVNSNNNINSGNGGNSGNSVKVRKKKQKKKKSLNHLLSFTFDESTKKKSNKFHANSNKKSNVSTHNHMNSDYFEMDLNDFGNDKDTLFYSGNISHKTQNKVKQYFMENGVKSKHIGRGNSEYINKVIEYKKQKDRDTVILNKKRSAIELFNTKCHYILDHESDIKFLYNYPSNNKKQLIKSIWNNIIRIKTRINNGSNFRCPICLETNIFVGRITFCGHMYCGPCLLHHLYLTMEAEHKNDDNAEMLFDIENFDFNNLNGYCPLCLKYINFEDCRPLTVINQQIYKDNDIITMIKVERIKNSPATLPDNINNKYNVSLFRKFEIELNEINVLNNEINDIKKIVNSSHPVYEQPYQYLLIKHNKTYIKYIENQLNNINDETKDNNNNFDDSNKIKIKYLYQSSDGQLIFLDPLNYNMLKYEYNKYNLPNELINCKIISIQEFEQSFELRKRYPFLSFIPLYCTFYFVYLDLTNIMSNKTLNNFAGQINAKNKIIQHNIKLKELKQEMDKIQIQKYHDNQLKKSFYKPTLLNFASKDLFPSLQDNNS